MKSNGHSTTTKQHDAPAASKGAPVHHASGNPPVHHASGNPKATDLARFKEDSSGQTLTTNQGIRINDDQNTLKGGARGPSLLEDLHLREKITHFDHERIPERVVHARGAGAHGYFQVYENMSRYTQAGFLLASGSPAARSIRSGAM